MGANFLSWTSALLAMILSQPTLALTVRVASGAGFLVQPTSSYFHAAYSGSVELQSESEKLIFRGIYAERPKFSAMGYIDQEYGYFGMIGTKLTEKKGSGLSCLVGFGRMRGYLAVDKDTYPDASEPIRRYDLPGPAVALEYNFFWKGFSTGIQHIGFTGFSKEDQTSARVAWPYNLMMITVGYAW